jgi:hypothetical protein
MTDRLTRRAFLATAAVVTSGAAALVGRMQPWRALVAIDPPAGAPERLVGLFTRTASAATIGRGYLATQPQPTSRHDLTRHVVAGLPAGLDVRRASDHDLRAALAHRIQSDFATERVATVDGWILSETEARLCALAALTR